MTLFLANYRDNYNNTSEIMYLSTGVKSLGIRLEKLGFKTYQEYLESDHWQNFRIKFFTYSKSVKKMKKKYGKLLCQGCKISNVVLSLHHITYKRFGEERLGDVKLLCKDCHLRCHQLERKMGKDLHRATHKTLRKIQWLTVVSG